MLTWEMMIKGRCVL